MNKLFNELMDGAYLIKETYNYVSNFNSGVCADFSDLYAYTTDSINHLKYSSSGLAGVVNDFMNREKIFCQKLKHIHVKLDSFTSGLENELKTKFENKTYSYKKQSSSTNSNQGNSNLNEEVFGSKKYYGSSHDNKNISLKLKNEIINLYVKSEKTLDDLSWYIEEKYGIYLSSATISKTARKHYFNEGIFFKNRYDAKKYYSNNGSKKYKL